MQVLERENLQTLFDALKGAGYQLIGPTLRDGAIVYDEITNTNDLPEGFTDEQEPGLYRLKKRTDKALFGYVISPNSWKRFLHLPKLVLWEARKNGQGYQITENREKPPKYALIGVRSCELHAIAIQDRVFLKGEYRDTFYQSRRNKVFIVAVNCGQAASTCFCESMGTGPEVKAGFDLLLTEVLEPHRHYFLIEAGSKKGEDILQSLPVRQATAEEAAAKADVVRNTIKMIRKRLEMEGVKELLFENLEHSHWEEIARRCLNCANCTMVCPTCFCTTVEDVTDLKGLIAQRVRRWDSCFTREFSYIHGGSIRASASARYRQWLTHKLASWQDQFGEPGCVGCGRCITWCPVGIDLTEEVAALREKTQAIQVK